MQSHWLPKERRVPAQTDLIQRLQMAWESKDSVWLLGFDQCNDGQIWVQHVIPDIMQQIYPTDNRTDQHPRTLSNREQLLATFRERLKQWKYRTDSLQHRHRDLEEMLESRSQHQQVRTLVSGTIMRWNVYTEWHIMTTVCICNSGLFYRAMCCYVFFICKRFYSNVFKCEIHWLLESVVLIVESARYMSVEDWKCLYVCLSVCWSVRPSVSPRVVSTYSSW